MNEIAPHVYVATEYAQVTVGAVLTSAGWVCIDTPPYPREAQAWLAALKTVSSQPVLYVINTDANRDRILGSVWFDAPVVAHAAAAEVMLGLNNGFLSLAAEELSSNDNELVRIASLTLIPPQISYTNSLTLFCGKHEIELVNRPGPTLGNTWVILRKERVIFAGDTIVRDQPPYISDGASKAWLEALQLLRRERYADWTIVSGRDGPVSPTDTERLSEYLRVARRRVASLCRADRPRAEVGQLVPEFMGFFPFDDTRRDTVQRRIRAGLEAIYEEICRNDTETAPE